MIYANEWDKDAAKWLGQLFPDMYVDTRSIKDAEDSDLVGYDRVHLFAGIGGWELACELAGWPSAWPLWTGSCPCQPFYGGCNTRIALGEILESYIARTGIVAVLDAAFSRWLMGFPQGGGTRGWDECSPGYESWELIQMVLVELYGGLGPTEAFD